MDRVVKNVDGATVRIEAVGDRFKISMPNIRHPRIATVARIHVVATLERLAVADEVIESIMEDI